MNISDSQMISRYQFLQFWIKGKAAALNSVAGPKYLLLPTGLVAAETATATWVVLASRTRKTCGLSYGDFHSHGGTPKWMVFVGENPIGMDDDLGVPLFWETLIQILW